MVDHGLRSVTHVARDLRGPVSVTRDHVRLLLDGQREILSDDLRRSIDAIDRQACRLEGLIDELDSRWPKEPRPATRATPATPTVESRRLPRVLVADDDPDFVEMLAELLAQRYEVTVAHNGCEALELLRSGTFDLAILDQNMPEQSGLEIAEQFAVDSPTAPSFMFLSGDPSAQVRVRGLSLGAADFVTKPVDGEELLARVARVIASVHRERSLVADAMSDPLTGLGNYRSLASNLERELERAYRYDLPLSLLTIDLDNLKGINDRLGHSAGNDAIRLVASVLHGAVRKFETVARQGGDELSILLPNASEAEALQLGERLCLEVAQLSVGDHQLSISIGVASRERGNDHAVSARTLVDASDEALYRAKRAGRNRVCGQRP